MSISKYYDSGIITAPPAGDSNSSIRSLTTGLLQIDHTSSAPLSDITVTAPTSTGGGTSLVSDGSNNVFKSLATTHPIAHTDAGGLITISNSLASAKTVVYTSNPANDLYTDEGKYGFYYIVNDLAGNAILDITIPSCTNPATSTTMGIGDEITIHYPSTSLSNACIRISGPWGSYKYTLRYLETIKFKAFSDSGSQVVYCGQSRMSVGTSFDSFIATNNTVPNTAQSSIIIGSDCNGSSNSVVLGKFALFNNPTPAIDLVAIGTLALADTAANVGVGCVAIGINAGRYWSNSADYAIAIGGDAARNNSAISQNRDYSIAIGPSSAYSDGGFGASIAIGRNANLSSSGLDSICIGNLTEATGQYSLAIGSNTTFAKSQNTTVVGSNSQIDTGCDNSMAIGYSHSISSSSTQSTAVGYNCTISNASSSLCIGNGATLQAPNSILISQGGASFQSSGSHNYIISNNPTTLTSTSNVNNVIMIGSGHDLRDSAFVRSGHICIGNTNTITAGSTSVGNNIVIGQNCTGSNDEIIAIGSSASGIGFRGIAIGYDSQANTFADGGISIGTSTRTSNVGAIAIGKNASSTGDNCVTIGINASSGTSSNSISIGNSASVSGSNSVVLGSSSSTSFSNSTIVGDSSTATSDNVTVLGAGSSGGAGNQVIIGRSSSSAGGVNSIVLGSASSSVSSNCMVLGYNSTCANDNSFIVKSSSYVVTQNGARSGIISCLNNDQTYADNDKMIIANHSTTFSTTADTSGINYQRANHTITGSTAAETTTGNVTNQVLTTTTPLGTNYGALLEVNLVGFVTTAGTLAIGDGFVYKYLCRVDNKAGTAVISNKTVQYSSEAAALNTSNPLAIINSAGNIGYDLTTTGLGVDVITWTLNVQVNYLKFA